MNINDFDIKNLKLGPGDMLDQIFERQLELMKKYHDIEKANGLIVTEDVPVNLHDARGQFRLKDFAWRITEEMGEALEALVNHPEIPEHYDEEIADALHFLTEFTILAGITLDDFPHSSYDKFQWLFGYNSFPVQRDTGSLTQSVGVVTMRLAIACNCLKNKPWKNTQMMTDVEYFKERVLDIWYDFAGLCNRSGLGADRMHELYFRKSEVNKFRQRSNY